MARALLKELEPFCFYKIYLVIIGRFDILSIKRGDAKLKPKVFIPDMLPFIISALSYSLGTAWKICITAELLASSRGIGARMGWACLTFDTVELMA